MEIRYEPRVLICNECHEEFVFTVAAQQYFAERGYTEDPKRCKSCHMRYKKTQRGQHHPELVSQDQPE
jgi:hypothetical protein